jgi:predicted ATPase
MIPPLLKDIDEGLREYFGVSSDRLFSGKDVAIFVGQNGSGKSFLRRMLKVGGQVRDIRFYDFSQERRSGQSLGRSFIYNGSEDQNSTGHMSLNSFVGAFKQDPKEKFILLWDEPEIGLSEESVLGLVVFIREQLVVPNKKRLGLIFMTHSRHFVQGFIDYPRLSFHDLDGKYASAKEWVEREPSPADIHKVIDKGQRRWKEVSAMLRELKEKT